MNNLNFDTHKFVEDMVEAKMPKAQAEVLVNACVVWLNGSTATKDDLNNLEKRFGDKLEQSEQRLRAEIKQSEQRLWIRMLVGHIALGGLIIGALGVFFAALQY